MANAVDLELVAPKTFPSPYGTAGFAIDPAAGYKVRLLKPLFPVGIRTSTRWFLRSWDLGFRQFNPDIIHVENEAHSFILLQAVVCRALFAPHAKLLLFVWANIPPIGFRGMVFKVLTRLLRSAIDGYLVGNSDGAELLGRVGVEPSRIRLVPQMGVEHNLYRRASTLERHQQRDALNIDEDDFVVGYVGRFVTAKGLDDLVGAAELLQISQPAIRVRMLAVGDGPQKGRLSSLGPQVIVVSPGGGSAALPYYRAMDVLVLPSRTQRDWKEQFGRVLIEAMASTVPVVGSDSGAIPEVVANAGLIFAEGDVSALAAHLETLAEQPELRLQLAERGRERVIAHYTAERIAQSTLEVYAANCDDYILDTGSSKPYP
jgi:glycosyltransferase involved in cell wall biosynthesis